MKAYYWPTKDAALDKTKYLNHISQKEALRRGLSHVVFSASNELTPMAIGLLVVLLSRHQNFRWNDVRIKTAAKGMSDRAVDKAKIELIEAGYLTIRTARHKKTVCGNVWFVTAVPHEWPPELQKLLTQDKISADTHCAHCSSAGNKDSAIESIHSQTLSKGEGSGKTDRDPAREGIIPAYSGSVIPSTSESSSVLSGPAILQVKPPWAWKTDKKAVLEWFDHSIFAKMFLDLVPGDQWDDRSMRKFYKMFKDGEINCFDIMTAAQFSFEERVKGIPQTCELHPLMGNWLLLPTLFDEWGLAREDLNSQFSIPEAPADASRLAIQRLEGVDGKLSFRFPTEVNSCDDVVALLPGIADLCEKGEPYHSLMIALLGCESLDHENLLCDALQSTDARTMSLLLAHRAIPPKVISRIQTFWRKQALYAFVTRWDDDPTYQALRVILEKL